MGLLDLASSASAWRGYEYYKANKVETYRGIYSSQIQGKVSGSENSHYDVLIDTERPRNSKCNCPHAYGKRIICKHMIALYFTAFPEEANKYYNDIIAYEEEEEKRQEELEEALIDYVSKMKKSDLQEVLLELLFNGPEWQYDRFIREYIETE